MVSGDDVSAANLLQHNVHVSASNPLFFIVLLVYISTTPADMCVAFAVFHSKRHQYGI